MRNVAAAFDVVAEQDAVARPHIRFARVTYVGVILSLPQFLTHQPDLERIEAGETTLLETLQIWRRYLRAVFPWRVSFLWFGDPVPKILALEPAVLRRVMQSFFGYQGAAMGGAPARDLEPAASAPSGSVSSP